MIEYMRRIEILRDAPGAEALKTPHRQQNLASFFTPDTQYTGQPTDVQIALRKTSPGLIKDKTVSANATFRDISLGAKGGATKRVQSGLVMRAEKSNALGLGVGLNGVIGDSAGGQDEMEKGEDYQIGEHKNTQESNVAISLNESAVKVVRLRPEEEADPIPAGLG